MIAILYSSFFDLKALIASFLVFKDLLIKSPDAIIFRISFSIFGKSSDDIAVSVAKS